MEIKGKLIVKEDTNFYGENGSFSKREFVVEYAENPQYPEFVKFELIQDKCGLLDMYNVGDMITIGFNLKGRKWTNPKGELVYFNSLQAWKIFGGEQAPNPVGTPQAVTATNQDDGMDDLPF